MEIFFVLMIALSLSMDAFSLALAYGTLEINKSDRNLLSIIVGMFHYFMPLFGMFIGNIILDYLPINLELGTAIILFFIGSQMIYSSFKDGEEVKPLSKLQMLLFGFAVSLDSFSVGITLTDFTYNIFVTPIIFAFFSFIFTFIGLLIGNKITNSLGKYSTIIGGAILIVIGIINIF